VEELLFISCFLEESVTENLRSLSLESAAQVLKKKAEPSRPSFSIFDLKFSRD
jgi:hypothetical protein